ncbi:hypothetical protein BDZ89DRAFT_1163237 [Hymenopellis radicata]|nr:hypothetical protein BDZ89DRAFT_1163237 [Hymenopellis radicata]
MSQPMAVPRWPEAYDLLDRLGNEQQRPHILALNYAWVAATIAGTTAPPPPPLIAHIDGVAGGKRPSDVAAIGRLKKPVMLELLWRTQETVYSTLTKYLCINEGDSWHQVDISENVVSSGEMLRNRSTYAPGRLESARYNLACTPDSQIHPLLVPQPDAQDSPSSQNDESYQFCNMVLIRRRPLPVPDAHASFPLTVVCQTTVEMSPDPKSLPRSQWKKYAPVPKVDADDLRLEPPKKDKSYQFCNMVLRRLRPLPAPEAHASFPLTVVCQTTVKCPLIPKVFPSRNGRSMPPVPKVDADDLRLEPPVPKVVICPRFPQFVNAPSAQCTSPARKEV